jgi:hypothetical protein
MRKIILLLTILFCNELLAQDTLGDNLFHQFKIDASMRAIHDVDPSTISDKMVLYEDSLVYFMDSLTYTTKKEGRAAGGEYFIKLMKAMLKQPAAAAYPFPDLKKVMNIIETPNKSFRIFNWQAAPADDEIRYYGVVQLASGKIYPLIDVSSSLVRGIEDSVLTDMKWYGCIYYNILERQVNGETKYFLLGFNGSGTNSNKKIVECMSFKDGKLILGGPHFDYLIPNKSNTGKVAKRFVAEYQKDAKVQLNWDAEANMILFDHLESTSGDVSKRYSYAPDGTYDGLRFLNNVWRIVPNAIQVVNTPEGSIQQNINTPKKVFKDGEDN